jgi:general secretion pathway protein K
VLWLSAALAAIGFAVANTVRGETERTSTSVDGLRAYYLAVAGVNRGAMELLWSVNVPAKRQLPEGVTDFTYHFETGDVRLEILPESGKLDINHAPLEQLFRLGQALGLDPGRADELSKAIDDWRRPVNEGSEFDLYYSSLVPSFRARHASFREIEELLQVKGVTPDLFYGGYVPAGEGPESGLVWHAGLADCLTVYSHGMATGIDINTAQPAVLEAVGVRPDAVSVIMALRRQGPISQKRLADLLSSLGVEAPLRVGGNSIVLVRATAQVRVADGKLSDLKRTVAAQVKYMPPNYDSPVHILRWYDTAWSN